MVAGALVTANQYWTLIISSHHGNEVPQGEDSRGAGSANAEWPYGHVDK